MSKQISSYNVPCVKNNKMYQIWKNKFLRCSFMFYSQKCWKYFYLFHRMPPILRVQYILLLINYLNIQCLTKSAILGQENLCIETKNVNSIPSEYVTLANCKYQSDGKISFRVYSKHLNESESSCGRKSISLKICSRIKSATKIC